MLTKQCFVIYSILGVVVKPGTVTRTLVHEESGNFSKALGILQKFINKYAFLQVRPLAALRRSNFFSKWIGYVTATQG
jgi:hypothetical protein